MTDAAPLLRRQLILVGVAAAVVLLAVVGVALVIGGHDPAHAALRPAPDGTGFTALSPLAESSHTAVWVAGAGLVAVAVVLAAALNHMWRVARFALRRVEED
ncbi:MAG TPA: hypothetical protein VFJ85_17670 [Acidimicrobiales bacterium]|nr:hypothetical protein [Acidimicrobiales bacterium]